jgi:cytosine/uracil/thiamine/allantoin permease
VGAVLGLLSNAWIESFAGLTLLLAGAFVPIGGILLAHYVVLRVPVHVPDLYDSGGPYASSAGWSLAGAAAWMGGAVAFYVAQPIGGSLPSLAVSVLIYVLLTRRSPRGTSPSTRWSDPPSA